MRTDHQLKLLATWRATSVLCVVMLVAAGASGCGSSAESVDEVGSGTILPQDQSADDSQDQEVTGIGIDYLSSALGLNFTMRDEGWYVARGFIETADSNGIGFRAVEVVSAWSDGAEIAPQGVAVALDFQGSASQAAQDRFRTQVISLVSDAPLPVLVAIKDGAVEIAAPLSDDLTRFLRYDDLPDIAGGGLTWGVHVAHAIDEGLLTVAGTPAYDPDRSMSCQDRTGTVFAYEESDGDEVASYFAWADRALDIKLAPEEQPSDLELNNIADQLAFSTVWTDTATGHTTSGWSSDIVDQLKRGVPLAEVEVLETRPFGIDPGDHSWVAGDHAAVLFVDTETGRLLGWVDYSREPSAHPDAPTWDTVEIMLPPVGDFGVYLRPLDTPRFTCTEDLPDPYLVIPRGELDNPEYRMIDLQNAEARAWVDPPG